MVPLREDVVDGIVFDRMDFSSRVAGGGGGEIEGGGEIDLSYFKTKVPLSLVGQRKRTGEAASKATSRRRRR